MNWIINKCLKSSVSIYMTICSSQGSKDLSVRPYSFSTWRGGLFHEDQFPFHTLVDKLCSILIFLFVQLAKNGMRHVGPLPRSIEAMRNWLLGYDVSYMTRYTSNVGDTKELLAFSLLPQYISPSSHSSFHHNSNSMIQPIFCFFFNFLTCQPPSTIKANYHRLEFVENSCFYRHLLCKVCYSW